MIPFTGRAGWRIRELAGGGELSAAQAAARLMPLAGNIAGLLSPSRRTVVVAHGNSAAALLDLFAVWAAGGTAVAANAGLTPGELETIVRFCDAAAVLLPPGSDAGDVAGVPACPSGALRGPGAPPLPVTLETPALVLFTSGTTGQPKGVVLSRRAILARVALNIAHIGADALQRTLCLLPTHFGHGLIGNCLTPLAAGATLFFPGGTGLEVAARLGPLIDAEKVTFLSSVPPFWRLALRSAPPGGGSLRRVSVGSAPLASDHWIAIANWAGSGAEVVNMYGLTETANWVGGASSAQHDPEDGLVGRLWGGHAAVRDAQGRLQASGEGEIHLSVPSLMSGYLGRDDLTAAVVQNGWYATGDIGTIDETGVVRLTGRSRYLIITGGINVFPEELDLLYERHPDVAEACAFGGNDPVAGQRVELAVALKDGARTDAAALRDWARERIRAEAVPARVHILDAIPRTDRGKLNRDQVAAACRQSGGGP